MFLMRTWSWQVGWALLVAAGLAACSGDAETGPGPCAGKGGDADGDDVCQAIDNCPDIANAPQRDTDQDGIGDVCDETPGSCDAHGGDADNDTICDDFDNCPKTINPNQFDRDFDNIGDVCDPRPGIDDSGAPGGMGGDSGVGGETSGGASSGGASTGAGGTAGSSGGEDSGGPTAGAGAGEECRGIGGDVDGDNWCGVNDNCFSVYNPDQSDVDNDGKGDACDKETCDGLDNDGNGTADDGFSDSDGDGVADCVDKCANAEDKDTDSDGIVDCRDKCPEDALNDPDFDGLCSGVDNCPLTSNANQLDSDSDGVGDVCETDICDGIDNDGDGTIDENGGGPDEDADGLCDAIDWCPNDPFNDIDGDGSCAEDDNCVGVTNPSQADSDHDGLGDACDIDEASACGASAPLGSTALPSTLVFNYLALDKTHSLLLGTVSGRSASYPNQLVAMSPTDGKILWSTYVGSDPSRIAVADDGSRAYVALDGAASVRVVQLEKRAACFQFPVVSPKTREVLLAGDMVVLPDQPETLVVAARRGTYSGDSTVQVLDNGGPRPSQYGGSSSYATYLELIDGTRLWAQSGYYSYGLVELRIDAAGIHLVRPSTLPNLSSSSSAELVYAGELLYLANGQVFDPAIPRLVGTFPATGNFTVDAERNEVFFAGTNYTTLEIKVYDTRTFTLSRTLPAPTTSSYNVSQIMRFGASGLILNTSTGPKFMTIGI